MYTTNSAHVSADTHTPPATNNQLRRTGVHQKVGMRLVVTEGSMRSDDASNVTRCVERWPAASTHHLDPSSVSMVSWELYVPTTKLRVISRNAGTMLGRPVATVVMYGTRSQLAHEHQRLAVVSGLALRPARRPSAPVPGPVVAAFPHVVQQQVVLDLVASTKPVCKREQAVSESHSTANTRSC